MIRRGSDLLKELRVGLEEDISIRRERSSLRFLVFNAWTDWINKLITLRWYVADHETAFSFEIRFFGPCFPLRTAYGKMCLYYYLINFCKCVNFSYKTTQCPFKFAQFSCRYSDRFGSYWRSVPEKLLFFGSGARRFFFVFVFRTIGRAMSRQSAAKKKQKKKPKLCSLNDTSALGTLGQQPPDVYTSYFRHKSVSVSETALCSSQTHTHTHTPLISTELYRGWVSAALFRCSHTLHCLSERRVLWDERLL